MEAVEKSKTYRIKGNSSYFKEKYGTSNPEFEVEDDHRAVIGGVQEPYGSLSWFWLDGAIAANMACVLYMNRREDEDIPKDWPSSSPMTVLYGKVDGMGELVHKSELEELE